MKHKKIFILAVILCAMFTFGNKNVYALENEFVIHVDNNVIYGESLEGYFSVDDDYDEIRFNVTDGGSITKSYTTTRNDNYQFLINSLDLDFGNFLLRNIVGVKNEEEIPISGQQLIRVWDGDMTPPVISKILRPNLINYIESGNSFGVQFKASDEDNVIKKVTLELIDEDGNTVKFEKNVNSQTIAPNYIGSTPTWNIEFGYWTVKSIEVCDSSYHQNCSKVNYENDNINFLLVNKKKNYNFNPRITATIDKKFILTNENQIININIENDIFKYVYLVIEPNYYDNNNKQLNIYRMNKEDNNYTLNVKPYNSAGGHLKSNYPAKVILIDQYGRYQEYELDYNYNTIFRLEEKSEDFIPIIKNINLSRNEFFYNSNSGAYDNYYINSFKVTLNTIEYNATNLKSLELRFNDGDRVINRSCNLTNEGDGLYSCYMTIPDQMVGDIAIDVVHLTNNNNYNSYEYEYIRYNPISIKILEKNSETEPKLLNANTVSFKDNLTLNFLAEVYADDLDGAYVKFKYKHYGEDVEVIVPVNVNDKNGKYYRFRCALTASEMMIPVTAELYLKDSTEPVSTFTRSIRDYIVSGLANSTNEKEKELFRATLNYGGYTQKRFNYNGSPFAYDDYKDDISNINVSSKINFVRPEGHIDGIKYVGSSVFFRNAPYVRYYFELENGDNINDYTFKIGNNVIEPTKKDNKYYIESAPAFAYQLDDEQNITVTKDNSNIMNFSYSVIKWAEIAVANTTNVDESNMAKAMYTYYLAAKDFVDSNS